MIRDGTLCFYETTPGTTAAHRLVIAYAAGSWKFCGLMDEEANIPNLEP